MPDGMARDRAAIAVTARSLDDYRGMFDLDDEAFTDFSFVDCASGASAFPPNSVHVAVKHGVWTRCMPPACKVYVSEPYITSPIVNSGCWQMLMSSIGSMCVPRRLTGTPG